MNKRIVALDVGDRRIGIAVSDPLGITAQPIETYTRVGYGPDVRRILAICEQYETDQILCGLPRNMDGSEGPRAEVIRAFVGYLAERIDLPIELWDERLSTVEAHRILSESAVGGRRRKAVVDTLAAEIILQSFLDAHR